MADYDSLFESGKPTREDIIRLYDAGRKFKTAINLYETVKVNEDFYIGKQWEGVNAGGLPTPCVNILKRDVGFVVASVTSDNLSVQVVPMEATPGTRELDENAGIINDELDRIFETLDVVGLVRRFARDAAVRGDSCIYLRWDPDAQNGQQVSGDIKAEILQNTRVFFGNPNSSEVESQPFIILESREIVRNCREEARENGSDEWDNIFPDDDNEAVGSERRTDDKVTKLLLLWREKDGYIWGCECTRTALVRKPWNIGIRRYPITWMSWDEISDSYHGQALITGLIPNQIAINKSYAMTILSLMTTAYPKIIYDRTRVKKWDNRVGAAIPVNGGDLNGVAKIMDPAPVSPQIGEFTKLLTDQTNANLGATSAALGDVRPDNTSAIIALQRAAQTPNEPTRRRIYQCVEDLTRIAMEYMAEYYGVRLTDVKTPPEIAEAYAFAGQEAPETIKQPFDYTVLHGMDLKVKVDVGASAYFSEIATVQTLDNLLQNGHINLVEYLERLPAGYVPQREKLIETRKQAAENELTRGSGDITGSELTPVTDSRNLSRDVTNGGKVV